MSAETPEPFDHLRWQLEQVRAETIARAMDAFASHADDEPADAIWNLAYAAGLAHALTRVWYGMGDQERSNEYDRLGRDLVARANKIASKRDEP
jgi:hypothetical protein